MTTVHIAFESPDQPEVIALIAQLDAYQDTLYPPESRHSLDLRTLVQPHVIFAVARSADGRAVGCGAVQGARAQPHRALPSNRVATGRIHAVAGWAFMAASGAWAAPVW